VTADAGGTVAPAPVKPVRVPGLPRGLPLPVPLPLPSPSYDPAGARFVNRSRTSATQRSSGNAYGRNFSSTPSSSL